MSEEGEIMATAMTPAQLARVQKLAWLIVDTTVSQVEVNGQAFHIMSFQVSDMVDALRELVAIDGHDLPAEDHPAFIRTVQGRKVLILDEMDLRF